MANKKKKKKKKKKTVPSCHVCTKIGSKRVGKQQLELRVPHQYKKEMGPIFDKNNSLKPYMSFGLFRAHFHTSTEIYRLYRGN